MFSPEKLKQNVYYEMRFQSFGPNNASLDVLPTRMRSPFISCRSIRYCR